MFWRVDSCSRPAIIIEPPDGSSIVFSLRRTDRPGREMDDAVPAPMVRPPWLVSSDTSTLTCREMRPSDRTTGRKARPTPKGLYSTVIWPFRSRPAGIGNSPPARKLAASPLTEVRFGSARVRTRPTRSKALIMASPLFNPSEPGPVPGLAVSQFEGSPGAPP
ncbi:hypothetical protein D3C85_1170470 [compost metagenome]